MAQYIILKTTWQQKRTLLRIKSSRAPKNKLASFYLFTKTNIYLIYPLEIDTCNVVLSFKKKMMLSISSGQIWQLSAAEEVYM